MAVGNKAFKRRLWTPSFHFSEQREQLLYLFTYVGGVLDIPGTNSKLYLWTKYLLKYCEDVKCRKQK